MNRFKFSLLMGVGLGIFCIIGIGFRLGFEGNWLFLVSAWYNRVILGLIIGLLSTAKSNFQSLARGALLGAMISFAWFLDTGFRDTIGFFAGIAYGIIIDFLASKIFKK